MLGCKLSLNINGSQQEVEFNSQEELTDFSKKNFHRINASKAGINVEFDLDPNANHNKQLEHDALLRTLIKESSAITGYSLSGSGDATDYKFEIVNTKTKPGYVGVTAKINAIEVGGKLLLTPFDREDYKNQKINQLSNEYKNLHNLTAEEAINRATKEVAQIMNTWPIMSEMGSEVHALGAIFYNNSNISKANLIAAYNKVKDDNNEIKTLDNTVISELFDVFDGLKQHMHSVSGDENLKFYTEVPIHDDASKIVGIVDLVAIDSKGRAYIADFKTSYKDTSRWDKDKKTRYHYQMAFYKRLLESKGIPVLDALIVPIKLESTDDTLKHVESISTPPEVEDRYLSLMDILTGVASAPRNYVNSVIDASELDTLKFDDSGVIQEEQNAFFKMSTDETEQVKYENFVRSLRKKDNGYYFYNEIEGKTVYLKPIKQGSNLSPEDKASNELAERQNRDTISLYLHMKNASQYENIVSLKAKLKRMMSTPEGYFNPFHKYNDKAEIRASIALSYYVNGAWDIVEAPELESQGILVFKNKISNYLDFFIVSEEDINTPYKLSKGESLLGEFRTDKALLKEEYKLPMDVKHKQAIKILSWLNANHDLFAKQNLTINNIKAFNYKNQQLQILNKQKLWTNYKILAHETGRVNNLPKLKMTSTAHELLSSIEVALAARPDANSEKNLLLELNRVIATENPNVAVQVSELIQLQREFEKTMKIGFGKNVTFDTDMDLVYGFLNGVIVELSRNELPPETRDMVKVGFYNSTLFTSYHELQSEVAKVALFPIRVAMSRMTRNYLQHNDKFRPVFLEFYKAQGVNEFVGDYQRAFSNLFERDSNGELNKDFKFKDPEHNIHDETYLNKAERKFLNAILPEIGARLYGDRGIANAKATGDYFNVPLLRASATSRLIEGGPGGIVNNVKHFFINATNEAMEEAFLFDEQREKSLEYAAEMREMYNRHDINKSYESRKTIIDSKGGKLDDFEKNLELVFADLVFTDMKVNAYNNALAITKAVMVTSMMQSQKFGNFNLENTYQYIRDHVKSAVFDEKIIEEHHRSALQVGSSAKHFVSMLQLGMAPLNLVREILQGQWNNISKLASKQYGEGTPSLADYRWALGKIIGEGPEFVKNVTMTEELNHLYRIANMDTHMLAEKMVKSKTGLYQISNRWWLWFMGAPDYFNRMAFLLAKMKKDGSYEAHTMVDEKMTYDWTKDARFSIYAAGKKDHPDYENQRGLYLAMMDEFNKENRQAGGVDPDLREGDALPLAYTVRERESMKFFVNYMHGPYDHEDKIGFHNTLMGVMFMQFKTWLLSKKMQYFMKGDRYAIGDWVTVKDEANGKDVYFTVDENGDRHLNTDGIGTPLKDWNGRYMEGVFNSFLRVLKETWSGGLSSGWDLLSKDSTVRANMAMTSIDMGFFWAIALLVKGLIDWGEIEKDDRFTMAVVRSISRSAEDLYSWNNLVAMFDGESMFPTISYVADTIPVFFDALTGGIDEKRNFLARSSAITRFGDTFLPISPR